MLSALRHSRRRWTREQKQTAVLVGVIVLLAAIVAVLLHTGAGRIP